MVCMAKSPCGDWRDLTAAIASLRGRLGRAPNASELAAVLGVDRNDLIERLTRGRHSREADLDVAVESRPDGHALSDSLDTLEQQLADLVYPERLTPLLSVLSEEERTVVLLRIAKSFSQSRIAARLGISPSEVSKILARSLAVLREHRD